MKQILLTVVTLLSGLSALASQEMVLDLESFTHQWVGSKEDIPTRFGQMLSSQPAGDIPQKVIVEVSSFDGFRNPSALSSLESGIWQAIPGNRGLTQRQIAKGQDTKVEFRLIEKARNNLNKQSLGRFYSNHETGYTWSLAAVRAVAYGVPLYYLFATQVPEPFALAAGGFAATLILAIQKNYDGFTDWISHSKKKVNGQLVKRPLDAFELTSFGKWGAVQFFGLLGIEVALQAGLFNMSNMQATEFFLNWSKTGEVGSALFMGTLKGILLQYFWEVYMGRNKADKVNRVLSNYYGREFVENIKPNEIDKYVDMLPDRERAEVGTVRSNTAIAGMALGAVSLGMLGAMRIDVINSVQELYILSGFATGGLIATINSRRNLLEWAKSFFTNKDMNRDFIRPGMENVEEVLSRATGVPRSCRELF